MSQFIKFYFTSYVLNMFRTLIHPSSGAFGFFVVSPHWLCVFLSPWVQGERKGSKTSKTDQEMYVYAQERKTHNQCGDTTEKS